MRGINHVKVAVPTEDAEQMALFRWAELQAGTYPELRLLFHIPNGGSRGKAEAGRFRAMGVKAGVPDLFLPVAHGSVHGLFIEMKRTKGGRVSKEQQQWMNQLWEQGYAAYVCCGWEQAARTIKIYLTTDWAEETRKFIDDFGKGSLHIGREG